MNTKHWILTLLLPGCAAIAGCMGGPTAREAVLSTDEDVYAPGARVEIELTNATSAAIEYNICFAFLSLERPIDDGWQRVEASLGPEPDAACTLELRRLAAGSDAESEVFLPDDLPSGSYRLATEISMGNAMVVLESDPFEVRR